MMLEEDRIALWTDMEEVHRKQTDRLRVAGLDEQALRAMAPDDRVELLEQAHLDPYDYIYLCY